MPNLIFINDKIYGVSIGNTNRIIYEVADGDSKFYTLIYDKRNANMHLEGSTLQGITLPFTSGWYFNYRFQNLIFRKFIRKLRNDSNNIIVYTSQQIQPFNLKRESVIVHDTIPLDFPDYGNRMISSILKRNLDHFSKAPVVAAVSNYTKQRLHEYGFDSKIDVIYNPVSAEYNYIGGKLQLRNELGLPEDKTLVLSVSANYPWKNLRLLKSVMDILGYDYKLIRVGPAIGDSINFHGISNETLNKIYNACDVLVIPSSYEGFGIPLVEGMAAGIPVVASDIEVFHEVADNAALFTQLDPSTIALSIKEALEAKEELRPRAAERAKMFSETEFRKRIKLFISDILNEYHL